MKTIVDAPLLILNPVFYLPALQQSNKCFILTNIREKEILEFTLHVQELLLCIYL